MTARFIARTGRSLQMLVVSVVLLLQGAGSAVAVADDAVNWTGVWDSRWRDGGALLFLEQDGQRVSGVYPTLDGVVEGRIEGRRLAGEWRDPGGAGSFTFTLSPDGRSFMGRFGTGEWWTAERVSEDLSALDAAPVSADSPAEVMFEFLRAGNDARDGRSDRLGPVLPLLDYGPGEAALTPMDRITRAAAMFRALDLLTFRVWSLQPRDAAAREHRVFVGQSGSEAGMELHFRQTAGGQWRLVLPEEEALAEIVAELLVVHNGEYPHARRHHELRSPRDTMRTFIEQWYAFRFEPTELFLRTMDLSQLPAAIRAEEGTLRGEYLKEVIDRIGLALWQEIPDSRMQSSPYVHFSHPDGQIKIVPVQQADGEWLWQFSAETVDAARRLFMALEDMPLFDETLRVQSTPFFELRNRIREIDRGLLRPMGGVETWQWLALVVWLVVSIPLSLALTWLIGVLFGLRRRPDDARDWNPTWRFIWPLRLLFIALTGLLALRWLGLPQTVDIPLRVAIGTVLSVAGGWIAYNIIDRLSAMFAVTSRRYRFRNEILHSLVTSLAKLGVVVGAVLFLAEVLSIPYQGVIAGLGIGGAALALASQGTLANILGGINLSADKPVEVGDFCRFGDQVGTVESIGLRSVRIRSLGRTLVSIPNSQFANMHIENFSRRDRILLQTTVQLRYETTPDQLRWVLAEIRRMLLAHPEITEDPARARFAGFGEHSVDIEIFAYAATADWNRFLAVREDVFLRLIDIVDASGTGFAFPSMVNYLARDGGVDEERQARTEAIMAELRGRDALPFPEFDEQTRNELRDTLDYPPEGSASRAGRGG